MIERGGIAARSVAAETKGATAPFTTPSLFGGRLRRAADGATLLVRCGSDVVSFDPHPPIDVTLHDRLLLELLKGNPLAAPTPRAVAEAATQCAALGAAGRHARHAAAAVQQRREEDKSVAQFLLALRLGEELGVAGPDWRGLNPTDPAFAVWLAESAALTAPALSSSPEEVLHRLEEIAVLVAPLGLPDEGYQAEAVRTMLDMSALAESVQAFADETGDENAAAVAAASGRTLNEAQAVIEAYENILCDLPALAGRRPDRRNALAAAVDALDWLLDGWDGACRLWRECADSGAASRAAAALEIVRFLLSAPGENTPGPLSASSPETGRDPAVYDKIYRNELLKAAT